MKHLYQRLVVSSIVMSFISISCFNIVFADNRGLVVGDNINLRKSTSTTSEVVGKLNNGAPVTILSKDGEWYQISLETGQKAFVADKFISVSEVNALINANDVPVFKSSSADSEVVAKFNVGDVVSVKENTGDYFLVNNNSNVMGYVKKEFLMTELLQNIDSSPKNAPQAKQPRSEIKNYALVTAPTGVNFRQEPSLNAKVLAVLDKNATLDIVDVQGEWIKVALDSQQGYVSAEFISIEEGAKPDGTASSKAQEIIEFAKKYLGTPYSWGGTSLSKGVDCSGFVYAVMKNFGITLNRSSKDQVSNGAQVSKSDIQAGDLVFFDTDGTNNKQISHVGIYMGNGSFIHASSAQGSSCVSINSLNEDYYVRTYVTAARILK